MCDVIIQSLWAGCEFMPGPDFILYSDITVGQHLEARKLFGCQGSNSQWTQWAQSTYI